LRNTKQLKGKNQMNFRERIFKDRHEAGKRLAERLKKYSNLDDVVVLALPRGGVPVAFEVAKYIGAPLDVFITRKLRFPDEPELALGALAENGEVFLNKELVQYCPESYIEKEKEYQWEEIKRCQLAYRNGQGLPPLEGKVVILIDDGVATGATMIATIYALRASGVKRIVVAVPVAPPETAEELLRLADELIVLYTPSPFFAVGMYYSDFRQLSDAEVREYLEQARSFTEKKTHKMEVQA